MTDRIIRIDINANNPVAGKTTLAAVIARAIKDQFPDQYVEILSQENDFLIRAQDVALGHAKIQADVVQIVDINANPQPLREGALFQTIIADIQQLPDETPSVDDPVNYPERPLALVSLVTEAVTKAVKADLGPAAQADADALLEIILNDPKFRQAAEEFECDRGDQYGHLVDQAQRDDDSRKDR